MGSSSWLDFNVFALTLPLSLSICDLLNLAFLIAAWAIWRLARQQSNVPVGIWILITLATSIGIGSALFHTFATRWANLLDVIPIGLFQLTFLWLYSRQVMRLKYQYVGALVVGFLLASHFSQQFPHLLNGSLSYAPAWLILFGLGIYHYQQQQRQPWILLAASGVFLLALTFRTLDQSICSNFSIGTHFLWHLCNGVLLYLSARALILNWSVQATSELATHPKQG